MSNEHNKKKGNTKTNSPMIQEKEKKHSREFEVHKQRTKGWQRSHIRCYDEGVVVTETGTPKLNQSTGIRGKTESNYTKHTYYERMCIYTHPYYMAVYKEPFVILLLSAK